MDRNKRWKSTEAERKTVEVWKRFIVIFINRNYLYSYLVSLVVLLITI